MNERAPNRGERIASMIIDQVVASVVISSVTTSQIEAFKTILNGPSREPVLSFHSQVLYMWLLGMAVYFCKDAIDGRSIAKRFVKLQVVENGTGVAAGPLRCLVRNLFCVFWPIEFIVTAINPSRRIGDLIAGTRVVVYDPTTPPVKTAWDQVLLSAVLAYAYAFLLMMPVVALLQLAEGEANKYSELPKAHRSAVSYIHAAGAKYSDRSQTIYLNDRTQSARMVGHTETLL